MRANQLEIMPPLEPPISKYKTIKKPYKTYKKVIKKDNVKVKNYYIVAAINSWDDLIDNLDDFEASIVCNRDKKDLILLCHSIRKRLSKTEMNGKKRHHKRRIHLKKGETPLTLCSRELLDIPCNSIIYLVGHGNPQFIGTKSAAVNLSPSDIAEKINIIDGPFTIKVLSCNSGVDKHNVIPIFGKERADFEFLPDERSHQEHSFAETLAKEFSKFGYNQLKVCGYIGFIDEKRNSNNILHSFSDLVSADSISSLSQVRSSSLRMEFSLFKSKQAECLANNKRKIDSYIEHLSNVGFNKSTITNTEITKEIDQSSVFPSLFMPFLEPDSGDNCDRESFFVFTEETFTR